MNGRMGCAWLVLGWSVVAPTEAAAQERVELRQVFASDSVGAVSAQLSPDGRWVVMRRQNATGHALWIAPAGGGTAFQLTSEGHDDRRPSWFASSDRIAFVSSRPSRNGGRQYYAMVQAIDPASGRAAGGPRQVSTEPVEYVTQPSPDGRWLAYVTAGRSMRLKVVPATGGLARELARIETAHDAYRGEVVFSPDSKTVFYETSRRIPGGLGWTIQGVPIAGGEPETLLSADYPIHLVAADPRYVQHVVSDTKREIRRLDGTRVATVLIPAGTRVVGGAGDGWGIMVIRSGWTSSVRVASLDGGEARTLVSGDRHWPEAWLPDGSGVITDRLDIGPGGDRIRVEILPVGTGRARAEPTSLPAGAQQSGWLSSIGPWFSYRMPGTGDDDAHLETIHAVNVLTGEGREVAASAIRLGTRGRGGLEQDGARWIYTARPVAGGPLEVRSVDPGTGSSALIRTLPPDFMPAGPLSIHGNRIAYGQMRGDSIDLMLTVGDAGQPRRIATFSSDGDSFTWSWDGTRIAVADWLPGTPRRGGVWLITVQADGTPVGEPRRFDLGIENGCDQFTWTPDDAQIVMLCYGDGGRIMKLRLSDGDLRTVVPGEVPQGVWEYYLSPDGRSVTYAEQFDAGATVFVADVRPVLTR